MPGASLSVHDIGVVPERGYADKLITIGDSLDVISLPVKTKPALRRKSVTEGAQENRDRGVRTRTNTNPNDT